MTEPLRVLVADDHPLFRKGLIRLLSSLEHVEVVAQAATGDEAVAAALEHQPDVVVMDLRMPDLDGVEATRRIVATSPHIRVLVLTMFEDDASVFAAMRAGALGYLLKEADEEEIARAVQSVASGEAVFGPAVARRVIQYFTTPATARPSPVFPELTNREREVLELLAQGRNNGDIARRLFLSPRTVRNHVSNIFTKLAVADRAQAIVRAREAGLGGEGSTR